MSQDLPSPNPYSAPATLYGQYGAPPVRKQPVYLAVLCVFSIALGCLGALRGGCVAMSLAAGGQVQGANRPQNIPPELAETFEKFEAQGHAVDAKYATFNKSTILVQALLGLALVVGGVLAFLGKRPGDVVLRVTFAATLLVSLVQLVPFAFQMLEMQPFIAELNEKAGELQGEDRLAANVVVGVMTGMVYGGICGAVLWLVIKFAVFGHGFFYLGRPQVQQYLVPQTD